MKELIANIFGMHLGCKVKYKGEVLILSTVISSICQLEGINMTFHTAIIEHCKLILKPLSSITEEDKRELLEKYFPNHNKIVVDDWGKVTVSDDFGLVEELYLAFSAKFELRTKGYDIKDGLVPEEFKIIVEE